MRGTPGKGTPTPRPQSWHAAVESGSHRVVGRPPSRPPRGARNGGSRVGQKLLVLGVGALTALGVVEGARFLQKSDALPVRSVAVRGVDGDRAAEITAYADVHAGEPLFGVDLDQVASRVLEHPWVRGATVRIVPPDGVEIQVDLRTPRAVLAVGELYLVDELGKPFKSALPGDGLDVPVISGVDGGDLVDAAGPGMDDVRAALALLAEHERQAGPGGPVSEVVVNRGVGLDVVFTSGLRVRFGRGEVPAKLGRLATLLAKLDAEKLTASFVYLDDARRPERVAVRLRAPSERTKATGT